MSSVVTCLVATANSARSHRSMVKSANGRCLRTKFVECCHQTFSTRWSTGQCGPCPVLRIPICPAHHERNDLTVRVSRKGIRPHSVWSEADRIVFSSDTTLTYVGQY